MTEQQQDKSTQPDPKHITAKDYYDYMMDGDGFDFFSAAKKQYSAESSKKDQKKQESEWESKPIENPTQPITVVTAQPKTKYKLQTGVGFNPVDVQEFNCILKGYYYNWFSRILLLVALFGGFIMPFIWIFFAIMLVTDKKQEAQFGIILKSGARGVINIKGKNNIIKFESELARSKYM